MRLSEASPFLLADRSRLAVLCAGHDTATPRQAAAPVLLAGRARGTGSLVPGHAATPGHVRTPAIARTDRRAQTVGGVSRCAPAVKRAAVSLLSTGLAPFAASRDSRTSPAMPRLLSRRDHLRGVRLRQADGPLACIHTAQTGRAGGTGITGLAFARLTTPQDEHQQRRNLWADQSGLVHSSSSSLHRPMRRQPSDALHAASLVAMHSPATAAQRPSRLQTRLLLQSPGPATQDSSSLSSGSSGALHNPSNLHMALRRQSASSDGRQICESAVQRPNRLQ